mmetsp:Transcript_1372/g.3276  ORF Transcript_1372/g.3276 Transcript_1372/m.3276 type:complete len:85 (+) Transcript_1372:1-255(+)
MDEAVADSLQEHKCQECKSRKRPTSTHISAGSPHKWHAHKECTDSTNAKRFKGGSQHTGNVRYSTYQHAAFNLRGLCAQMHECR